MNKTSEGMLSNCIEDILICSEKEPPNSILNTIHVIALEAQKTFRGNRTMTEKRIANIDLSMIPHSIKHDVSKALKRDDLSDLSPEEFFDAYCTWQGLFGYSKSLYQLVLDLEASRLPKPL